MPRPTALDRIRQRAAEARAARDAGLIWYGDEPSPWMAAKPGNMNGHEYERRLAAHVEAELHAPTQSAAWAAIRQEAIRLALPVMYRTDLIIDMNALAGDYGPDYDPALAPFGWNLYRTGTNIIAPTDPRKRLRATYIAATLHSPDSLDHWYIWQPKEQRLHLSHPAQIDSILDVHYERQQAAARLKVQQERTTHARLVESVLWPAR
jgi:hypothetical protein